MSTQHSLNEITKKKIKLDEVDELVSGVAKYKRCAILKYCNESAIEKNQLDILSNSNELHKLGMSYYFLTSIMSIILELYENFFMLVINQNNLVIITT